MKAFISSHIAKDFEEKSGIEALPLDPFSRLDKPVDTHADMLVLIIEDCIFCYDEYYIQNKAIFDEVRENYKIIRISKACKSKYPDDIALNVLIMGKTAYANLKYTASEVLSFLEEREYTLINVNQGYSACSTLVLDENNAVTADKSLYDALIASHKNVLLIREGNIALEGYNYGFIGGASAVVGNEVYFFGNIKNHPDYEKIHQKIESLHMKEICISSGDVFDFGGIRLLFDTENSI